MNLSVTENCFKIIIISYAIFFMIFQNYYFHKFLYRFFIPFVIFNNN